MEADNRWMSDPALKGIDKSKIAVYNKDNQTKEPQT